jgi:hypothetical protein
MTLLLKGSPPLLFWLLTDCRWTTFDGDQLVKQQTSVIRTNCMDCLDRTNVVQSTFARHVIAKQLVECGIFKESDRVDMYPDFERLFRNSISPAL